MFSTINGPKPTVHFILKIILKQHLKRGASTLKTYLSCYEQVLREVTCNFLADQDIKKHLMDRKVQVKTNPPSGKSTRLTDVSLGSCPENSEKIKRLLLA